MPGTVIRVEVAPDDEVARARAARDPRGDEDGDPHHLTVPATVKAVNVAVGERVAGGAVLVELES